MGKITVLAAVLVGLMVFVPSGSANAEVLVDDFDTGNHNATSFGGTVTSYNSSATNAIGGTRHLAATLLTGSFVTLAATASSSEQLLFANAGGTTGRGTVDYGWNGSTTVDSNWDFSGESDFRIDTTFLDSGSGSGSGGYLVATVYDGSSGASSYSTGQISWPSSTGAWFIPFASFSGSPTWSAIDRIRFRFTATNAAADINLDVIKAVPEPSTLLLLLGGGVFCGASAWRRRRRRTA